MKWISSVTSRYRGHENQTRAILVESIDRNDDDGPRARLLMTNSGIEVGLPNLPETGSLFGFHLDFILQFGFWLQTVGNGHIPCRDFSPP